MEFAPDRPQRVLYACRTPGRARSRPLQRAGGGRAVGALPRLAAEHRLHLGGAERGAVRGARSQSRARHRGRVGAGGVALLARGAALPARGGADLRLSGPGAPGACVPAAGAGRGGPVDERLEVRRLRAAGAARGAEGAVPRPLSGHPRGDAARGGLRALPRQAAGRALCLRHRHRPRGGGVAAGVRGRRRSGSATSWRWRGSWRRRTTWRCSIFTRAIWRGRRGRGG